MFKKFTEGLVFGGGFGVSFIALWYIAAYLIYPMFVGPQIEQTISKQLSSIEPSSAIEDIESWNSLSDNEKLQKASALIVLRYKQEEEGLMSAYVAEVHKKNPSVEVKAKVGDRRESSDFYSRGGMGRDRDGAVVFLTGSPARERSTRYLYENRLAGTSDMPMSILLKKFTEIFGVRVKTK